MAATFGATVWLINPNRIPEPAGIGILVAAAAFVCLVRPRYEWILPVLAGYLAGLLAPMMIVQGLPRVAATLLAPVAGALSAYFSVRSPNFAPASLRSEAMLLMIGLGLLVAIAPGLSSGWISALALNAGEKGGGSMIPIWVLSMGAASIVLGGVYTIWRRN